VPETPASLIDGEWAEGQAGERIEVLDPATEAQLAAFSAASNEQVAAAAGAARRAFDSGPWPRLAPRERSAALHRLADLVEGRGEELAQLLVEEIGCPIRLSRALQVGATVECLRWFADAAARGPGGGYEQPLPLHEKPILSASVLRREPAGVVAAITAYNYPLLLLARKLGGALAAGCTVVVMPSPRAPLSTVAVLGLLDEAGLPPGVVNLAIGGPDAGVALTTAPEVDMISFTGSREIGSAVMTQAAPAVKKVVLELGGKSPNIVLPGADLETAVGPSLLRFVLNTGQGCGATTRTLVPRADYDQWVEGSQRFFAGLRVGDPREEATDVGPLIRAEHRDRVHGFVARALDGGASVEARADAPGGAGYFMDCLLVGGVDNADEICQEELFGPVGVLMPFDDVDQALALANSSRYGLNANVWGPLPEALEVARRLRTGTVTINGGGGMRQDVPWGGLGESGIGREAGEDGFAEYLEVKHVQWPLAGTTKPFGAD
jgi:aldehyde dehydrogenase (NAD+)/betaine-aldehyde dehydrogenase